MISQTLTLARRGEGAIAAAIMTIVGVVIVLNDSNSQSRWLGWWQQTTMYVHAYSVIVLGSVMVGAAAWQAQSRRRRQTITWERSTPRGGLPATVTVWLASALPSAAGILAVFATAFAMTSALSDSFEPAWSLVALTVGWILSLTAVGTALGSVFSSRLVPPLAAGSAYALIVALGYVAPNSILTTVVPFVSERWDPDFIPRNGRLLLATAWILVAGAIFLLPAARAISGLRPRTLTTVGAAVLCAALLTSIAVIPRPDDLSSPWAALRSQPTAPHCVRVGDAEACFWPQDKHLAAVASPAVARLSTALHGVTVVRPTFHEIGLRVEPASFELRISRATISSDEMILLMVSAIVVPPDCPTLLTDSGMPQDLALESVLLQRAGLQAVDYGYDDSIDHILALEQSLQDDWLDRALARHLRCDPVEFDVQ